MNQTVFPFPRFLHFAGFVTASFQVELINLFNQTQNLIISYFLILVVTAA